MATMVKPPAELFAKIHLDKGVLLPQDEGYKERQESYWSSYSKAEPGCIVRPASAKEVSSIVQTLVSAGQKFAVRSGGHMQWYGANNIKDGVQIDLCLLDWTKLDAATGLVDIGPGAQWKDVYAELEKHSRMVAGGRNGKVGVGGLLVGGGKTFYTGSRGFACDDVVAYEIVLADGRILNVDADNSPDLFLALKGGSANFGIVTNFKMRSFPGDKIWAGLRILPKDCTEDALVALEDFTKHVPEDPDSNLLLFLAKMALCVGVAHAPDRYAPPDQPEVHVIAALVQVGAIENPPAYKKYLDMPAVMDTCKETTIRGIVTEYDPAPNGYYNCFFTLTIKNDVRIFRKAAELHDQLVEEFKVLIPDGNFLTECLYQPLPRSFGQRSAAVGGNVMGLADQPDDGVLFVAIVVVKTAEQEAFAYPKLKAWGESVRDYAASIPNGLLPWVYMNYADKSQNPLASYGADNVKKLKAVAEKYDPAQVFQKLCPGGWKVSEVTL